MRCNWFVCESGERWKRAVCHFGPAMLPAIDDVLNVRRFKQPDACQKAIASETMAVVLWELPAQDAASVLRAIDLTSGNKSSTLQLVALSLYAKCSVKQRWDIELALREIGATAVLADPVSLASLGDLVRAFWQQHQRNDNLSMVHQIWDRLPWPAES